MHMLCGWKTHISVMFTVNVLSQRAELAVVVVVIVVKTPFSFFSSFCLANKISKNGIFG